PRCSPKPRRLLICARRAGSRRPLAKAWRWERSKASRALSRWSTDGQITKEPGTNGRTVFNVPVASPAVQGVQTAVEHIPAQPAQPAQADARPVQPPVPPAAGPDAQPPAQAAQVGVPAAQVGHGEPDVRAPVQPIV